MGFLDDLCELLLPKQYGVVSVTKRGETVKSKAEKLIADYFYDKGIEYKYEPTVEAHVWWVFNEKLGTPDFYLPNHDVYVEYWGLVDIVPGYYRKVMRQKMYRYRKHGIRFISLYPEDLRNLDQIFPRRLARDFIMKDYAVPQLSALTLAYK